MIAQATPSVFASRARVVLIERDALVAKGIASLIDIDPGFEVVGEVTCLQQLSSEFAHVDLVVFDVDGFAGDAVDAISRIRMSCPMARILVLTTNVEPLCARRFIACEINGYIVKDISPLNLLSACRVVIVGGLYFDSRVGSTSLFSAPRPGETLSPRELEVIKCIGHGLSNKHIGVQLAISERTVKNHISRILSKLAMESRTQVAVYASRNGLI